MKPPGPRDFARARRWLGKQAQVGLQPELHGRPTIYAAGARLVVGDRFRLASLPVGSHCVVGPGALLRIGDDVAIGHGAAIAAYERVEIGDGTRIGPFVIIMDTNFHGGAGGQAIEHDCKPVVIGRNCRIGSRVTITRGVTLGDGAEVLAGSVVSASIPPGACAAGVRSRVIGRPNDLATRWDGVAAALPGILLATLGLDSEPDLDDAPLPEGFWTAARLDSLVAALKLRFDVVLDRDSLKGVRAWSAIVPLVQLRERADA